MWLWRPWRGAVKANFRILRQGPGGPHLHSLPFYLLNPPSPISSLVPLFSIRPFSPIFPADILSVDAQRREPSSATPLKPRSMLACVPERLSRTTRAASTRKRLRLMPVPWPRTSRYIYLCGMIFFDFFVACRQPKRSVGFAPVYQVSDVSPIKCDCYCYCYHTRVPDRRM